MAAVKNGLLLNASLQVGLLALVSSSCFTLSGLLIFLETRREPLRETVIWCLSSAILTSVFGLILVTSVGILTAFKSNGTRFHLDELSNNTMFMATISIFVAVCLTFSSIVIALATQLPMASYYLGYAGFLGLSYCLLYIKRYFRQQHQQVADDIQPEMFSETVKEFMKNQFTLSSKDCYLGTILCQLVDGDIVTARQMLEKFNTMDAGFGSNHALFSTTPESKLLAHVIAAVEASDVEAFTEAVANYDAIKKLDSWKTGILLKIKQNIRKNT